MDYSTSAAKFGTVDHEGATIALVEEAYADNYGTDGAVRYYARGIDQAGHEYGIAWETTAEWNAREAAYKADPENANPNEDESEACDWSAPVEVRAL